MSRHPIMREESLKALRIPDLMGGINLRDSVNMINDNQLTECLNMWWADGALKTRPAVEGKVLAYRTTPQSGHALNGKNEEVRRHNCTKEENGREGQLCSVKTVYDFSYISSQPKYELSEETDENGNTTIVETQNGTVESKISEFKTVINFFWCFGESNEILPALNITGTEGIKGYFAVWHEETVYCFLSNKQIWKYSKGLSGWTEVKEENTEDNTSRIYVPLVAAYCKTNGSTSMTSDEVMSSGVAYEGYNLLSNYYRMQYEGFNYEAATGEEGQKSHKMNYFLLDNVFLPKYDGARVTVKLTRGGETYTGIVNINLSENSVQAFSNITIGNKTYQLQLFRNRVSFLRTAADDGGEVETVVSISEADVYTTIEIEAPYISDNRDAELERIFSMKDGCWYGGSAEGMDGGTRLFLCGSETEKALVIWSGRNNPLYFPENAYFYVGDKSGTVTGFGKQSNLLIIFKNYETWCTQYYRNTDIMAKDLVNQTVVDYTASSVYFPLTLINSNIGCAYPDTIALCRNRLVWLSHGGQVYTLVSENQYNERSIFCISEMVSSALKKEKGIPTACDWNGHYVLCFGGRLYLMDYNSYGYQYVASYSKNEDANLRIPWYYWELPETYSNGVLTNLYDQFMFVCINDDNTIYRFNTLDTETEDILNGENKKIESCFVTKLFDFGAPSYKKNIQLVNLLIGNNGGDTVKVELVTEQGSEEQEIELENGDTAIRSAGYITNKAIIPCIRAVRLLGVKVSSCGVLAVDGMQFNYRMLGGIR